MLSRILVPMDESDLAERALQYALEAHPNAEITVFHVIGEPSPMMGKATGVALEDDLDAPAREQAKAVFATAREIAAAYDREIETDVGIGHPGRAIVVRAEDFDTVVIGSHGSTFVERLFVGNIAETVFRRAPVPVTVVR